MSMSGISSRPTRARGLKLNGIYRDGLAPNVAPYAGAWIETQVGQGDFGLGLFGRALRGRVD